MKVVIIAAMDVNRGIGKDNDLMWHLPDDMRFFKETTKGHIVVMGRKNWDSIPQRFRPFSDRENVVLTRSRDFKAEGARVFHTMEECLLAYKDENERTVFIIGGGEIYRLALELNCVDEMFITHVNGEYEADTFLPEFNEENWEVSEIMSCPRDEKNEASFEVKHYRKRSNLND
jgi:dihydrofolate reductase